MRDYSCDLLQLFVEALRRAASHCLFLLRCFMKQIVTRLWQMLFARNYLEQRAKRGSREKFECALSRVPDVEPEEYDKL